MSVRHKPSIRDNPNRLTIESGRFTGIIYELLQDHLIVHSLKDGTIATHRRNVMEFVEELAEIMEIWEGVRT